MNPSFSTFLGSNGKLYSTGDTTVYGLEGKTVFNFEEGTYFVYIHTGRANYNGENIINRGMYGSFTDGYINTAEGTTGIIIHQRYYKGLMNIGRLERLGRLRYMDGCTSTLLVPPVYCGDPCLNYLHFPTATKQTPHTHPSIRVGMVVKGRGFCVTPFGNAPLWAGQIFIIHPENGQTTIGLDRKPYPIGLHSFRTDFEELSVLAFHPDSDWGATDEDHPMLNRTFVDGVSMRGRGLNA